MTAEEIEIVVTAKVTDALNELKKIAPYSKKELNKVQNEFNSLKFKDIKTNIDLSNVRKQAKDVADYVNSEIGPTIQMNGKKFDALGNEILAQKPKIDKTVESLRGGMDVDYYKVYHDSLDKLRAEMEDKPITPVSSNIETNNDVQPEVNTSSIDNFRSKLASIQPFISELNAKIKGSFTGGPFDYGKTQNELNLVNLQIDKIENKLQSFQDGKITLSDEDIKKSEVELDKLYDKKEKIEKGSEKQGFFSKLGAGLKSIGTNVGEKIGKIGESFGKNESKIGGGFKDGIKNVAKYAMALFSLRSIYSVLSGAASSWLSSQNSEAQQLNANISYMKYALGSTLAPVIQFITNQVYNLLRAIQQVAYAFSGVNIFAKASASSMKSVSGGAKKAKDETKTLANVHNEINNISDNKNNGGSGGGVSPSMDLSKMKNTPNAIMDAIKNGNWYEVGALVGEKINEALDKIPWNSIQDKAKNIGKNIADFLNGGIETINWDKVGSTIASGINTGIYFAQSLLQNFHFDSFGKAVGNLLNGFFRDTDWGALANTLSLRIIGAFDAVKSFCISFDWSNVLDGLWDFITNIDWNGIAESISSALGAAVASLLNLGMYIGEGINKGLAVAKQYFQGKIEECGGSVVDGILKGIVDAFANIGQWINDHIFKPFIAGFKSVFGIHSPSTVMAEQGQFIMEGLLNGIESLKDRVGEKWNEIKDRCVETFNNIRTNISNTWESVKTNASEKWNNIKTNVTNTWTNMGQKAGEKFNNIKSTISNTWNNIKNDGALSTMSNKIKSTFTNLASNASTWGHDLANNMANGIRNAASKVGEAAKSVANKIKGLLGFSEPEEGPLSNFHTYMPDMIDLMVKGIKGNEAKVQNELSNLSKDMSYTINTEAVGNYSTPTHTVTEAKPTNIAETIQDLILEQNNGNAQPLHITVECMGEKVFDKVVDYINDKTKQTGKNTIVTVEN